jgi:hypothetical protein
MIRYLLEHGNEFWPALAASLMLGLAIVQVPAIARRIEAIAPDPLSRAFVGLLVGATCFVGWTKGPVSQGSVVAQFVTALRAGGIVDESGLVAKSAESETVAAFADLAGEIVYSASNVLAAASEDIAVVAYLITNESRRVAYIAADLPRADPQQHTNHNIAATIERVRQSEDGSTLSLWTWYSQEPVIAPGVGVEIDVGGGWLPLVAVTNFYPATDEINGIPCVRYDFAVPALARHVVFRPEYELGFGHGAAPLLVPSGGVSVETGGVTRLPYSGIDVYFSGRAEVVYHGGIATGLRIDGNAVTNGVYSL